MTTPRPIKIINNIDTGIIEEIELTDEEIAELDARVLQAQQEQEARQAEIEAKEALKASARQKLITGQPLTEEEASVLII